MPYFAIFLLILCFLKTFYYGLYEFRQKENKLGGISVCLLAILRTYFTYCYYFCILYFLKNWVIEKISIAQFMIYFTIFISAYFLGWNSSLYGIESKRAGICCLKYNR